MSDNLALDFVGTLNERRTTRVENLHTDADVIAWLNASGALTVDPVGRPGAAEGSILERTIGLREALFRMVERLIDRPDESPDRADRALVNRFAQRPPPLPQVNAAGRTTVSGDWTAGLSAVARDGIALYAEPRANLKWCADEQCTHPFLDRSRGHRRRWCDMAGCGDRAKAAAYRARQRRAEA